VHEGKPPSNVRGLRRLVALAKFAEGLLLELDRPLVLALKVGDLAQAVERLRAWLDLLCLLERRLRRIPIRGP